MKGEKPEKYIDVKSAKDSRSLQVLLLLQCERAENQFKEGAHGCKACSALPAARLCFPGAAQGAGLEVGRGWRQC